MDCVDVCVPVVLHVDDPEVNAVGRHARFSMYCVKSGALNVVAVSLIFVCTAQTTIEKSTATHVDISKHRFRQSDSDREVYNVPPSDATPSCLVHVSHPVKRTIHADIIICHNKTATIFPT